MFRAHFSVTAENGVVYLLSLTPEISCLIQHSINMLTSSTLFHKLS